MTITMTFSVVQTVAEGKTSYCELGWRVKATIKYNNDKDAMCHAAKY